jgi:hypothetical protein
MTDREREATRQRIIALARARRQIVDGRVVVDLSDAPLSTAAVIDHMPDLLRIAAEIAPAEETGPDES